MAIEIRGKVKVSIKFKHKSNSKKLAIITIGIPSSGKTTWAEQQKGYVNLNLDDFREKISGDATNQNVSKQAVEMRDAFLRRASEKQQNVIISDTNINPFFREKLELQLKQAGYVIQYKIFDIALDEAKARNSKRERKVPEDVVEKMHSSLQEQFSNKTVRSDIYHTVKNSIKSAIPNIENIDSIADNFESISNLVLSSQILKTLPGNIYAVGGTTRSILSGKKYRDLDLVYDGDLPELKTDKNSNGGYKLEHNGIPIDLWTLKTHKPFKTLAIEPTAKNLADSLLLNFDCGSYCVTTGELNINKYKEAIELKTIGLNRPLDYVKLGSNHATHIVKTLALSSQYGLKPDSTIKEYANWWLTQEKNPISRINEVLDYRYTNDSTIEKHVYNSLINLTNSSTLIEYRNNRDMKITTSVPSIDKKLIVANQDLYRSISKQPNEVISPINTTIIEPNMINMPATKSIGTLDELIVHSKYSLNYNDPVEAISRIIYYASENRLSITEPSVVAYIRKYKDIITIDAINKEFIKLGVSKDKAKLTDIPWYLKSILGG